MSDTIKTTWTINGLLAVILVLLAGTYVENFASRKASAAPAGGGGWETGGVMVLSTNGPNERMVLVDTNRQNIMVYKARNGGGFGLTGVRSYKYDLELDDTEGMIKGNGWTFVQTKLAYEKKAATNKTP